MLAAVLVLVPVAANAQSEGTPKEEIFVGYQWLNPGATLGVGTDSGGNPITYKLPSMPKGVGVSGTYNFSRYFGLEANYGSNWHTNFNIQDLSIGPKLTLREDNFDFFVHTLISLNRFNVDNSAIPGFNAKWGVGSLLGGGMDMKLTKKIYWRIIEADFQWAHQDFAEYVPATYQSLRRVDFDGARLSTGVVFMLGGAPELPVGASCSIDHSQVNVGEPVHVTVATTNFHAKHALGYAWTSTGGAKIEGKDTTASIDTNGLPAGDYTATVNVTDAKASKNNSASCSSKFTVVAHPPQVSCSASPSTVDAGGKSTISCTCTSPDNATVSVGGWSASGGNLTGSGNSATLDTTGASPGTITVHATCTDSRGLKAETSAPVTVSNPPPPPTPPPAPQASKLNECQYPNKMKPWRVDNTCKAMLDDVAAKLQQDPDAKLVVVGNADAKEKRKNLAGERAVDVKYYLTQGEAQQHIDASRIECRTGTAGTMTSEQWIIPAGATFPDASSTTPVDEKKVKNIPDHPHAAAKKMMKKKKAE
jgi:hypothetical protein